MALDAEITYWAARAEEEKLIAASLPDGPPASIHRALAKFYERAIHDKKAQIGFLPIAAVGSREPDQTQTRLKRRE